MTEPDKTDRFSRQKHLVYDGREAGFPRGALCLGWAYAEPRDIVVGEVAIALKEFWMSAAHSGTAGKKPWMSSVSILLSGLGKAFNLQQVCVSPWVCCPLPRWLKEWNRQEDMLSYGYLVPSTSTILNSAVCVNLWERQWPAELVEEVEDFVNGVLDERCGRNTCHFVAPDLHATLRQDVKNGMLACLPTFLTLIDHAIVYKAVADVHDLLQRAGDLDVLPVLGDRPFLEVCVVLFMVVLPKYLTEVAIPDPNEVYCMVQRAWYKASYPGQIPKRSLDRGKAIVAMATWSSSRFLHQPGLPWGQPSASPEHVLDEMPRKLKKGGASSSQG